MKKAWRHLFDGIGHKMEHLSPKAKDRLAILAGYQNWKDLEEALHGDDDGELNYDSN